MQKSLIIVFKGFKFLITKILIPIDYCINWIIFYLNGVKVKSFSTTGIPLINVGLGGEFIIGNNFKFNNREIGNPIGRFSRCSIIVGKRGKLIIGNNVGISSTAIVCHKLIEIGDNVKIGGNVVIYDTDFHSLNAKDRKNKNLDLRNASCKPVKIGNNVFIGAHSTILKGVSIGDNSIIGASSTVTKSISANQIWAGNPAKFIKNIN